MTAKALSEEWEKIAFLVIILVPIIWVEQGWYLAWLVMQSLRKCC